MIEERKNVRMVALVFTVAAFCFSLLPAAEAQSNEGLGINTLSGEQYFCERSGSTPKKNKILIAGSGKKSLRKLSAKRARVKVRKAQKSAAKRKKTLVRRRKEIDRKLKKFANRPLDSLANQGKIVKLQEQLAKFDSLIAEIDITRANLAEVLSGIARCTKPQPLSGSLEVVSGTYQNGGTENFYARLVYRVSGNPSQSRICALVSGNSEPVSAAGGVYYLDPPFVSNMFIRFGTTCLAEVKNLSTGEEKCFATVEGPIVSLIGINGAQAPGSCSPKHRCSLSEAVSVLSARAGQIGVTPLGLTNQGSCNQDISSYR